MPILVNSSCSSSDPTDEVPADMRVVLRKMHKKDLTTKIKVSISAFAARVTKFYSSW